MEGSDRAGALRAAAELRGAADALGALQLADLAASLEAALRDPEDPGADTALAATREALDALDGVLRDARARGWPPE